MIEQLNEEQFKERVIDLVDNGDDTKSWVFKGDKPAIIDFYATWCAPCKMLSPIVEGIAEEFAGRIDVYKVDTDAEKVLSRMFQIRSVPSLLLISTKEDSTPQMILGAIPREGLLQAIEKEFDITL